jgi:subtilase family serine protease
MRRSSSALSFLCRSKLRAANFSTLILCILILSTLSFAAAPDRIAAPIAAAQSVRLAAGVPLQVRPELDQGAVDPSLKLSYITLLTVPSASQKRALNKLLADQQNPRSASYHKWLTPEQYADRFGLSPNDIKKLTAWLQSQGFTVVRTARGRNWIVFSGTAAQAENAFQTQIHTFNVNGEIHFANNTPIAIPAALSGIVAGIRGLSDFRPKSHAVHSNPDYTLPLGNNQYNFFLAPGDIATMYDIGPLYTAGIDGTGMTLAVMGQTDVYLNDLAYFRSGFGLSPISCTTNAHNVITACNTSNFKYLYIDAIADPGAPNTIGDDLPEADIDLEWSGAAARNAKIIYVNAPDPNGGGTWDSWYYAVDNTVAPVITLSYGVCELQEAYDTGTGEFTFSGDEAELQKANSEGITFMNSSADQGAANCDYQSNYAVYGYAVSYPASSPEVTGVGGTLIPYTEYTATYWSTTNGTDGGSAKSYIPEQVWNDAEETGTFCIANPTNSFCNGITDWATAQSVIGIWASGGGVSNCVSIDVNGVCQSGFPQPSWQAALNASAINPGGFGVTTTPTRFSPDVSLMASTYWPGYLVCTAADEVGGTGTTSSCSPGGPQGIINDQTTYGYSWGGTSVAAPIFAGIVTLLNQQVVASGIQTTPGLGNINPMLYTLAAANSTNKAFNPVTTPNTGAYSDGVWCQAGTPTSGITADPWPAALQCPSSGANAGFLGFDAFNSDSTTGYNLATGLGSVDVANLFTAWVAAKLVSTSTTVTSSANPANYGASVTFTATVTTTGSTPLTGTVTIYDGTTVLGSGTLSGGATAFALSTSSLTAGTHSITAVYGGDSANAGSTSPVLSQVIVAAPTFTITTPSTPATPHSGQTTTSTFKVTPTGTTTVPITFACNGLPDATVTCSAPPIAAGATGVQTVTLTITTTGPNSGTAGSSQRRADNRSPWLPLTLPLAGIVMVGLAGRKMSKHSAIAGLCVSLALLGLLIACGGSNPPVTISVSPAGATVFASGPAADNWPPQTATFTPTVNNTSNTAVNWTLTSTVSCTGTPNPCGSITSGGVYTAPTAATGLPGSVTVTATSQADSTKTATATITIKPTTVPGSYPLTVTATEGPTPNTTAAFTLTVQ